jgi:hypothetical protein
LFSVDPTLFQEPVVAIRRMLFDAVWRGNRFDEVATVLVLIVNAMHDDTLMAAKSARTAFLFATIF